MKQSRGMSFLESIINIAVGLGVAMIANAIILPAIGFPISLTQNAIIAAFMTVVSIARSFALRRLFEALHIRHPISPFMAAVIAERRRQIDQEGWSLEHDDAHRDGDLLRAGICYLLVFALRKNETKLERDVKPVIKWLWPWEKEWWKPREDEPRRDAVRGVALAVAEGEKFDRSKTKRGAR